MYSVIALVLKIESSKQAEAYLQIGTTILSGLLSGLVAYFIASIEIRNHKKELEDDIKRMAISNEKTNIHLLERLLIEINDNDDICNSFNVNKDNIENIIDVLRVSISDYFWKINFNKIRVSSDLLVKLNIYYKNIHLLQTANIEHLNSEILLKIFEKQTNLKSLLKIEIEKKKEKVS